MTRSLHDQLAELGACDDALSYLRKFEPESTLQQAWDACKKPGWMLWLIGRCRPDSQDGMRALLGFYLAFWDRMFPQVRSPEEEAFLRLVREVAESPDITLHHSRKAALMREIPVDVRWASGFSWGQAWVEILEAVVSRVSRGLASHHAWSAIGCLLGRIEYETGQQVHRTWDSTCALIRLLHPVAPDLSLAEYEGVQP